MQLGGLTAGSVQEGTCFLRALSGTESCPFQVCITLVHAVCDCVEFLAVCLAPVVYRSLTDSPKIGSTGRPLNRPRSYILKGAGVRKNGRQKQQNITFVWKFG